MRAGSYRGWLELLGRRRPVTLETTLNKSEHYPIGPPLLKPWVLMAYRRAAELKRSEFGMTYGIANGLVGDEVELIIELEAAVSEPQRPLRMTSGFSVRRRPCCWRHCCC